ncbi:CDP-alcohol phosphatidyltransferase family protein [Campylobacter sp. RM9929]|uniref:CDP-alcohol phosphatidyltransferase family protein n=1 Tax=Campylobacter molothri TaxID=1032242 RepID=UPI001DEDDFDB|nr:CDP-alcohol phosphatidyltransferase family protein [Campylobacter sp. RM9929]
MDFTTKIRKKQRLEEKSMYLIEYVYRILIVKKYLNLLAKLNIHPIMVTLINTLLFPCILYLIYLKYYILSAFLIQFYAIFDHTDGMLARYTGKQTYIGSRLDRFNDNIFFNAVFIMVALSADLSLYFALVAIVSMNLHNFFGLFYFPKKMKQFAKFKRFGLKKWFLDRNFILGIDASLLLSLFSIFLILHEFQLLFYIISFCYIFDLVYRIIEIKLNEREE